MVYELYLNKATNVVLKEVSRVQNLHSRRGRQATNKTNENFTE